MGFFIDRDRIKRLKENYQAGCRVKLIHMNDPFNSRLFPGELGTVVCVDDVGTIHVKWDNGSTLSLIPGEDEWARID